MHQSSSLPYAAVTATILAPGAVHTLPTRGPPAGNGPAAAGSGAADPIPHLAGDLDWMARARDDVVIHRIFAAGLDLQAALGLLGERPGASRVQHAIDELDQAIRDIRDTIFGIRPRD